MLHTAADKSMRMSVRDCESPRLVAAYRVQRFAHSTLIFAGCVIIRNCKHMTCALSVKMRK